MAISKYRFVSPGVQVQEIDNSTLAKVPDAIGPVVIGRSVRGPLMRPVRVESYQEFVEIFGEPHPGGDSTDVWRNGNKTSPLYGAYAAQAYLKNSNALTFIRLGGFQNSAVNAATVGKAGWKTTYNSGSASGSNGGAYGLFVVNTNEAATDSHYIQSTGTLAAILYVDQGHVQLIGKGLASAAEYGPSAGAWVRAAGSNYEFKLVIADGTTSTTASVNFDPNSEKYIRSVLNTNPTLVNEDRISVPKSYWLGETFKTQIDSTLLSGSASTNVAGVILKLASATVDQGNFLQAAINPATPWITGQHLGTYNSYVANSSGEYPVTKLFRVRGLSEGEWLQKNVKISIEDIAVPNDRFNSYGTFTLSLRKITDTDLNPEYIERFVGLTLDPNSDTFIARVIGDKYSSWDYSEKRFYEYGSYGNKSKYVYVELNPDLEQGAVAPELIPFGFYGPRRFASFQLTSSTSIIPAGAYVNTNFFGVNTANKVVDGQGFGVGNVTASLVFPTIPTLATSSDSSAASLRTTYWGIKTNIGTGKLFNEDIKDLTVAYPASYTEDATTPYGFYFSMDDLFYSGSVSGAQVATGTVAYWEQDARRNQKSLTSATASLSGAAGLLSTFNKFTVPLVGGFDGLDITEKDPFNKTVLTGLAASNRPQINGGTELTNYAYNSVKVAIESLADPEVVEMNLAAIPGVENEGLTGLLIDKCEARGDALAVIDLKGDYVPTEANTQTAVQRKPVVNTVIDNLNGRAINSSYGTAFFPWVQVKDNANNKNVWVPPSVVALGVMSKSQRNTELWFAPAGFNRGGLTEGAAGLAVNAVTLKLTSRDRDNLYAANVNPIASFPSEGIVVLGQKTLQVTPSALDRINVRRLMIYLKKEISRMATTILFDPNTEVTWKRFTNVADPFLSSVKSRFGLTDYKLVLDESTTTPELIDRNIVYAKVFLKPARAIEFIALDFFINKSGAGFNDN